MLTIKAKMLHLFKSADYTNRETGEVTLGKNKLQLLMETPLKNGGFKNELLDISIPPEKVHLYKDKENEEVEVEVALIGKATFYGI
ncbi:MAG: hypothetical protein A2513_09590 [Sulfurimonas sp. RIFOXYD12_FULL_33_39]|uniref:hypothetical protein n=1 Tax=unclassified Sulfurimonas TaxID=2623549 RepID=UPI0008AB62C4|nr:MULTISPECIES: hypothetical protein [unclassified Sulfurimonas]OHE10698.1 MAG: hypothetical protein A2513_09590 [Sulfurimonas sp. RIFOXYD12_FULL_33_39]OHE13211.1 MAG: hypothetical protein A2530_11180 [Sulfurimonas sp. RIFOXYD2_FULL_34_21]